MFKKEYSKALEFLVLFVLLLGSPVYASQKNKQVKPKSHIVDNEPKNDDNDTQLSVSELESALDEADKEYSKVDGKIKEIRMKYNREIDKVRAQIKPLQEKIIYLEKKKEEELKLFWKKRKEVREDKNMWQKCLKEEQEEDKNKKGDKDK